MIRYPESRQVRRLAKKRAAVERQEARREAKRKAREVAGSKFGTVDPRQDDRRQVERRDTSLTPQQVEARMRALGISTDRRSGRDRRSGADRRS